MRDTIYRDDAIRVASGYCHPANIPKELAKLPSALLTDTEEQSDSVYKLWKRAYEAGQRNAQSERETGRWIWVQYDANPKIGNFHCSVCGFIPATYNSGAKQMNYCPSCGAKMEE